MNPHMILSIRMISIFLKMMQAIKAHSILKLGSSKSSRNLFSKDMCSTDSWKTQVYHVFHTSKKNSI